MSNDEVFFFVSFPAALTMSNFVRYMFVFLTKILTFSIASWCLCDNTECSNAHYEHFFDVFFWYVLNISYIYRFVVT